MEFETIITKIQYYMKLSRINALSLYESYVDDDNLDELVQTLEMAEKEKYERKKGIKRYV